MGERHLRSLGEPVIIGVVDRALRQVVRGAGASGLELGDRLEHGCNGCHEVVGSTRRHLVGPREEGSGFLEATRHHPYASEHHRVGRLRRGHLTLDHLQACRHVTLGEVDHRRQRHDQPGIHPLHVEGACHLKGPLGLGEAAGDEADPAMDDRESLVSVHEVPEPFDVAGHGVGASDVEQRGGVVGHQVGCLEVAAGLQVVLDRAGQVARGLVPARGCLVQLGPAGGGGACQFGPQQVAQQVVEPEPRPRAVERDDELVGPGQALEPRGAVGRAAHLVDERTAQAVQDRHLEQAPPLGRFEGVEELLAQVVGHQLVVAVERRDEVRGIASVAQRQRREHEPRRPALGPARELLHGIRTQPHRFRVEEPSGLLGVEPQVRGTDLGELVTDPEASEPEWRIHAGGDHEHHVRGAQRDEAFDAAVHLRVGHEVVVVEHQHHLGSGGGHVVDHSVDHCVGAVSEGRGRRLRQ